MRRCQYQEELIYPPLADEPVTQIQSNTNDVNLTVLLIEGGGNDLAYTKNAFLANMSGFSFDTHHVNSQGIPTLAQLQNYDVVLLWENGLFIGAQQTGNVVEQYVQAGGNLIMGTFYWQERSDSFFSRPGWGNLENIDPFTSTGGSENNYDSLDNSSIAVHPLTSELASMDGFYHGGVAAKAVTIVVANWSDGVPLIGFRNDYCIVDISHFPSHNRYIEVAGQFYKMWENALNFAGSGCVVNYAPIADADGPYLVAVGADVTFDGSASFDPDGDSLTETWTADGGTVVDNLYTAGDFPGIYDVTLVVNDGTVDSAPDMTTVVVYDPTGGFVTGGGWIYSDQDMEGVNVLCVTDEDCDGRANFGFVSKYKKGASVPTGETQFHFQDGEISFHSNVYDWLVVNQYGQNAQYKGTGTVNGTGDYGFMLWAGDNGTSGDTFRIKIWNKGDNDAVVYDNGFDQEIGGGQIVIHTGKK